MNRTWKSIYCAAKPTSSRPASSSISTKVRTARDSATGRGVPLLEVLEQRAGNRDLPAHELCTGDDEVHEQADVEIHLLDGQGRAVESAQRRRRRRRGLDLRRQHDSRLPDGGLTFLRRRRHRYQRADSSHCDSARNGRTNESIHHNSPVSVPTLLARTNPGFGSNGAAGTCAERTLRYGLVRVHRCRPATRPAHPPFQPRREMRQREVDGDHQDRNHDQRR